MFVTIALVILIPFSFIVLNRFLISPTTVNKYDLGYSLYTFCSNIAKVSVFLQYIGIINDYSRGIKLTANNLSPCFK